MPAGDPGSRCAVAEKALADLQAYPAGRLAGIFREVGFGCELCGRCCTRLFNGHVFLLEDEADRVRALDPGALFPAPDPEFCDQHGRFYVSGYALRQHADDEGSCYFLDAERRCRIYAERPLICRIYPYMLHRERGEDGRVDWRQISGLDLHGTYGNRIPHDEAIRFAQETIAYERAVLVHEIAFLRFMAAYFGRHRLRHVRKIYDDQIRALHQGSVITARVWHRGRLQDYSIRRGEDSPPW